MTEPDVATYDRVLIKALTADNEKLRTEIDRLRAQVQTLTADLSKAWRELDEARAAPERRP
jgi:hypothetical protein